MTPETVPVAPVDEARRDNSTNRLAALGPWRSATIIAGSAVLVVLILFLPTVRAMVRVWNDTDTFAHCYFVLPLAAFMVWRSRSEIEQEVPRPSVGGVVAVFLSGAVWVLAHLAQVKIVEEFAFIGMVLSTIWGVLGTRAMRPLGYPLSILFLAVPFGDDLFPILIRITGSLAAGALHVMGAAVIFDGRHIRLPNAEWSISESCSGLRFVLTVLAVGWLFAYQTYRSNGKRFAFLALCVAASILMNAFRVWLIVLVGFLSDMKSPLVHNHAWVGWVLFVVMILLLFYIGRRWREEGPRSRPRGEVEVSSRPWMGRTVVVAALCVGIATGWAFYARALEFEEDGRRPVTLVAPGGISDWVLVEKSPWEWTPGYAGARASYLRVYGSPKGSVAMFVALYRDQGPGAEMIHGGNDIVVAGHTWRRSGEAARSLALAGRRLDLGETDLRSPGTTLRVWRWYWAGGEFVSSPVRVKLNELRSKVQGQGDAAAVILVGSLVQPNPEETSALMTRFVTDMLPVVERSLRTAAARLE